MPTPVVLPKQGQTVESCIITQWKKQVGDVVTQGDVLCEVETDKAVIDVESPTSGVLLAQFFAVGDDVPVLTTIAAIGQAGEDTSSLNPHATIVGARHVLPSSPTSSQPVLTQDTALNSPSPQGELVRTGLGEGVSISPRARRLATRKNVDMANVRGTGAHGRIIERDVIAALNTKPRLTPLAAAKVSTGEFVAPSTVSGRRITTKDLQPIEPNAAIVGAQHVAPSSGKHIGSPLQTEADVTIIPLKGVRKTIAARMLASIQTTAQLTLNSFADARALLDYRQRSKKSRDTKVTIGDMLLFAVARTLPKYPDLNALFADDTIYQHHRVHLSFAVDTPRGLIVPVIHDAHLLSVKALSVEASRLAAACLSQKITPDELSGGTFTVSDLSSFGIETFTPILNPPQVGILGVGEIHLKPVDVRGEVQFLPHVGLSLTINHQVIDGAYAARFLKSLARNLANIDTLIDA